MIYKKFNQSDLDREYAPSSRVDDIRVYLDAYARKSSIAVENAGNWGGCNRDLSYGPHGDELLDLFAPRVPSAAPIQIYIHGGYWQALGKDDSLFAASMFQQHGAFFAATNYTLAPSATLTEIVDQNRRAIAWLYINAKKFGFDGDKIYLSGSSAGAHLVMMMLLTDWTSLGLPANVIKGVCAVSGVYDLEPVRLSYVNDAVGMDAAEAAANSPVRKKLQNPCPVILSYGDNETAEFKRQTDELHAALTDDGEDVSFQEISNRNHFDVIMDLEQSDSWLAQAVLQQMGLT